MPIPKPPYPAEFRRQMVELVQAGRTPSQLAREFGCTAQSISVRRQRREGIHRVYELVSANQAKVPVQTDQVSAKPGQLQVASQSQC